MTTHSGPVIAKRDNLTCIFCEKCGYAHLSEFPSEEELSAFYASDFWQKEKVGALAEFERAREWWKVTHGDWLTCVEAHTSGRTLLDVGSGFGLFLGLSKSRGWDAYGIEPNEEARNYSYKTSMKFGGVYAESWEVFDDWKRISGHNFDCISAHWLIEHLPNPLDFLLWCKSHLAPGGVLLAVVPQEWTEAQTQANEIVTKKNWHLDATHLNYFSQTSFANLLGRAGFRIVDMLASYPMEKFITDIGSNYVDNPELGSLCHRSVEKMELAQTREQRLEAGRERARYGKGRDLIIFAKANQ